MSTLTIISIIAGAVVGAVLIYAIIYWIYNCHNWEIVKSTLVDPKNSFDKGDYFYYLPGAAVNITATAIVSVQTGDDGIVVSANVDQLDLSLSPQYIADTNKRYKLVFNDSVFSNDDLDLKSNADGLLESADLTVEDRTPAIIAQISNAPAQITSAPMKAMSLISESLDIQPAERVTVQVLPPVSRTFTWNLDAMDKPLEVTWKIPVPGPAFDPVHADASFKLDIQQPFVKPANWVDNDPKEFGGIITRPYKNFNLTLHRADAKAPKGFSPDIAAKFKITLPDPHHTIGIPLERSAFVKKTVMPKFANGLLIENHLVKPSQAEAFVSLPIKVIQAIVSIPAQLLTFKINHLQQEAAAVTAQQKLLDAVNQLNKTQQAANALVTGPGNLPAPQVLQPKGDTPVTPAPPESAFRSLSLATSQEPLTGNEKRVITPAGYRISLDDAATLKAAALPKDRSPLMAFAEFRGPTADDSWKLDAEWQNNTGLPVVSFNVTWTVPKAPVNAENPQVFFLFNGLQNQEHLVQCVLQWGESHLGGGQEWMIGCWHAVNGGSFPKCSKLVGVKDGDILSARITGTPASGGLFNYSLVFDGHADTLLELTGIPVLSSCCLTLESYMMQESNDYPQTNGVIFNNITVATSGRQIAPNWLPKTMTGDLGVSMNVVSPSQVNMFFRTTNSNNLIA